MLGVQLRRKQKQQPLPQQQRQLQHFPMAAGAPTPAETPKPEAPTAFTLAVSDAERQRELCIRALQQHALQAGSAAKAAAAQRRAEAVARYLRKRKDRCFKKKARGRVGCVAHPPNVWPDWPAQASLCYTIHIQLLATHYHYCFAAVLAASGTGVVCLVRKTLSGGLDRVSGSVRVTQAAGGDSATHPRAVCEALRPGRHRGSPLAGPGPLRSRSALQSQAKVGERASALVSVQVWRAEG